MHLSPSLCVGDFIPCFTPEFVQSQKDLNITPFPKLPFFSLLPPASFQLRLCVYFGLATFDHSMFASFSPQIRQTGKLLSSEVNAN